LTTALVSSLFSVGNRSPTCVVITVRTDVDPITCASVCAKFSSTTIATAPESLS
jgi:hypothetical protein